VFEGPPWVWTGDTGSIVGGSTRPPGLSVDALTVEPPATTSSVPSNSEAHRLAHINHPARVVEVLRAAAVWRCHKSTAKRKPKPRDKAKPTGDDTRADSAEELVERATDNPFGVSVIDIRAEYERLVLACDENMQRLFNET
jgi:hypothetical protein